MLLRRYLPSRIPRVAFERMFGDGTSSSRAPSRARAECQYSRFDNAQSRVLRKASRRAIRSGSTVILKTFAKLSGGLRLHSPDPVSEPSEEVPFGLPQSKDVHFKLMYDLMALAFEGDVTRSATMLRP